MVFIWPLILSDRLQIQLAILKLVNNEEIMSARDPESLMYDIINLIDEIDNVTSRLNQIDYVFGSVTLRKPKFSPAELGFLRLVSWLYVLYYEKGKVNVNFLVNRFSVYNLDTDNKLNIHLLNIQLTFRTSFIKHSIFHMPSRSHSNYPITHQSY